MRISGVQPPNVLILGAQRDKIYNTKYLDVVDIFLPISGIPILGGGGGGMGHS